MVDKNHHKFKNQISQILTEIYQDIHKLNTENHNEIKNLRIENPR